MDFYQKYELIDPLPGEGTRSFRARQIATGREVAVHLLVGGKSAENETLLTRLRSLPEGSLRKLIEVGDNEGTTFVATEAPPFLHLAEWLAEQERDAHSAETLKYTHAGTWRIPAAPAAPPPPAMPPAAPPAPSSGPGEFTRMFQQSGAPAPPTGPPEPGEFTRLFQASQAPPAPPAVTPQAPPRKESPDMAVTQTMRIPIPRIVPPVPSPAPSPTVSATPPAGEFTRMFQSAGAANPSPPPPQAAKPTP